MSVTFVWPIGRGGVSPHSGAPVAGGAGNSWSFDFSRAVGDDAGGRLSGHWEIKWHKRCEDEPEFWRKMDEWGEGISIH